MLDQKPVQYHRLDGTGMGADAGSGEWTGKKRRKQLGTYLHREVRTSSSDSPAQEDQGDPFFTAADLEEFHTSLDEIMELKNFRECDIIIVDRGCILDDKTQRDVYDRLVLYRLKAHKLSKRESIDEETLKKELPDFLGKRTEHLYQLHFDVDNYFNRLEKDEGGSVCWYFDPEFSKLKDLGNYQRLVLKNHDHVEYLNWEFYHTNFTTYKMDKDYVTFFAVMSSKLQWLKKYIGKKGSAEWRNMETRGSYQALKIATRFPGLTLDLANTAYWEHIWSLHYDYLFCEEWDAIFLEIWNLVTKKKLKFTPALRKVKNSHSYPRHEKSMLRFLKKRSFDLKSKFDSCVRGIPHDALDGDAIKLIREELLKLPRPKILHQYKKKKMEIAKDIGLDKDCSEPQMLAWDGNCESGQLVGRVDPGSLSSTPSQAVAEPQPGMPGRLPRLGW